MNNRCFGKKSIRACTCGCILLVIAVPWLVRAQSSQSDITAWEKDAGSKMAFDVASVKENKSGVSASNMPTSNVPLDAQNLYGPTGGLFSATNFPLLEYMRFAYKLTPEQDRALMSQVPWANTNRWDIEGRASDNPTKDQMRLMLQAVLADRFKLKLRFETRQLPVFAVVLNKPGKFGPQLRAHVDEPPCSAAPAGSSYPQRGIQSTVAGGFPESCGQLLPLRPSAAGDLRIGARDVPMAILAMLFSSPLTGVDRPVVDSTELKGNVDLIMEFTPQRNGVPPPDAASQPADTGTTFLEAVKDQLGLKLEPTTGSVDTLVIDHIEQPTPN